MKKGIEEASPEESIRIKNSLKMLMDLMRNNPEIELSEWTATFSIVTIMSAMQCNLTCEELSADTKKLYQCYWDVLDRFK